MELSPGDRAQLGPVPLDLWKPVSPGGSVAEALTADGRYLRLRYEGAGYRIVFVLGPEGRNVWATWNEKVVFPTVAGLLLGAILGCLLRLQNRIVLHGSAVAFDDKVLVLMGNKGSGKTTTALALVRQGGALVTDDLVVLNQSPAGFEVPPARLPSGCSLIRPTRSPRRSRAFASWAPRK